jgi:hypothetical protein
VLYWYFLPFSYSSCASVMLTNNYLMHVLLRTTLLSLVASYYNTFDPLFDLHHITHNNIKCNCHDIETEVFKHCKTHGWHKSVFDYTMKSKYEFMNSWYTSKMSQNKVILWTFVWSKNACKRTSLFCLMPDWRPLYASYSWSLILFDTDYANR